MKSIGISLAGVLPVVISSLAFGDWKTFLLGTLVSGLIGAGYYFLNREL
jgi:hypothetical protein